MATGTATATITDNDAYTISLAGFTVAETEAPQSQNFVATMSGVAQSDVVLTFNTTNGSAVGTDFTAVSSFTATIPAGQTSVNIPVSVLGDDIAEATETFTGTISISNANSQQITVATGTATATITDNDAAALSINDMTVNETDGTATFTVTLTGNVQGSFTVDYATASGTAMQGTDFISTSGTLNFVGTTGETHTIVVPINNDSFLEQTENYLVNLSTISNNLITFDNQATGTINDNDASIVSIVASQPNASEPTTNGEFTLSLSNLVSTPTIVNYTISGTAVNGVDYILINNTITIPANTPSITIPVTVIDDNIVESTESAIITIVGTNNGVTVDNSATTATVMIADNDITNLSIGAISASEGSDLKFPINLSNPSSSDITITFKLTNGTAGNLDYVSSDITVTIPAYSTSGIVTVPTNVDIIDEPNETITLSVKSVDKGVVGNTSTTAIGTIIDNNLAPTVTIGDATAQESKNISFPLILSNPSSTDIVLTFKLTNGSAGDLDYNNADITITIPAGTTSTTIVIPTTADIIDEMDETFTISVKTVVSGNVGDITDTATGTINDDENYPIAFDDNLNVKEDLVLNGTVATNDYLSGDGGNVWTLKTSPTHGNITFNGDGTFVYTPNLNYNGVDTFTYLITDANGDYSQGSVTITVVGMPEITKSASKPIMNNDGTYNWKYTIVVNNDTNQQMDSVQVEDNLDDVFLAKDCTYKVTSITATGGLMSNGLYNGSSIINTLDENQVLPANKKDSIIIEVRVDTHRLADTITVFNQAILTCKQLNQRFNILSDAISATSPLDPTQTDIPEVTIYIPDGFSPNDDPLNQTFVITHSTSTKIDFEVFNRWGNSVYKNRDYQNDWNGKGTGNFLGKDLPNGTYYCIYKVIKISNNEVVSNGVKYITLRR